MGSSASLSLNFTSITTSHAGTYTCQTNLFDEIFVLLESQFNITLTRNAYIVASIAFVDIKLGSIHFIMLLKLLRCD